jgi:hypothetical protein
MSFRMISLPPREAMTTAEQTEDILMLLHSKSHADKKLFTTMSDVCEALIVFSV